MKRVFISCPLRGENLDINMGKARTICNTLFREGYAVLSPTAMFTVCARVDDELECENAFRAGLCFLKQCEELWYFKFNGKISEGMQAEIDLANELGIPVLEKTYENYM